MTTAEQHTGVRAPGGGSPHGSAPSPLTPAEEPVDLAPLAAELSAGALVTDPDVVLAHSQDRAIFSPVGRARALVRARSVEDVQATMRFATAHRLPVVPQGARTGLAGAANATDGALLLSVAAMNAVLDIDTVEQTARVQPGVINRQLKDALAPHGLAYPPDPGSVDISSLGGNVATNAGGLCCVKYGVTKDYVRQLRVVLADGSLTTLGRPTAKGVAGFDLASLFVGSEGSLGVVVEIVFDLIPALPDPITGVALFADIKHAAATITEFMASGATPSLLEIIDGHSIDFLNDYGDFGLPAGSAAMLLVQSNGDGSLEAAAAELEQFQRIAESLGAVEVTISDDPADSELFVAARRAVAPAMEKFAATRGGGELVDDVCVPRGALTEFFARMEAIAAEHEVFVSVVGHAGDGNMHPAVIFDAGDEESTRRAHAAFDAIMEAGLDLGGTITGEHGVGVLKNQWLARELDPVAQRLHLAIKRELDPLGLLSPGKMLQALRG
ncbi:FAD-binding oxidoreductase [Brevibacterium album]|uniref:FAD-binding oxidoreductase n=1 Tax=Brevibacterium album TaxID=417948 RepID=UPI0004006418|nr:FAD-linked oxidase C-terminal domain-containing protein [Brevibacterium album]